MKIIIFHFSGTGNTEFVANQFLKELAEEKNEVILFKIEDILKKKNGIQKIQSEIKESDIIGIGYPIHAFNAPRIVYEFIKKALPQIDEKKTFIFKCAGDPLGKAGSTSMMRKKLKNKGFIVFYEQLFIMPSNIIIKYNNRLIKQLYQNSIELAQDSALKILQNTEQLQKNGFFLKIFTKIFSSMESWGTKSLKYCFKCSDECNFCRICIKKCPKENIYIENNGIKWRNNCVFCMRCVYSCPKNAISIRYFNKFIIKNGYSQKENSEIFTDPKIDDNYLSTETKGYFKHFYKFILKNKKN